MWVWFYSTYILEYSLLISDRYLFMLPYSIFDRLQLACILDIDCASDNNIHRANSVNMHIRKWCVKCSFKYYSKKENKTTMNCLFYLNLTSYIFLFHLGNSHDFVSCMLYWIHLVICERSILCCMVYFVFKIYFLVFKQFDRRKPTQLLCIYTQCNATRACVNWSINSWHVK